MIKKKGEKREKKEEEKEEKRILKKGNTLHYSYIDVLSMGKNEEILEKKGRLKKRKKRS